MRATPTKLEREVTEQELLRMRIPTDVYLVGTNAKPTSKGAMRDGKSTMYIVRQDD